MKDLSAQLLADWNYYRLQTKFMHTLRAKNAFIRPRKLTPETHAVLIDFQKWCREHKLEPRLWMYALFKLRNWMASPKMERGHLMSTRLLGRYKTMTGLGFFRRRRTATQHDEREDRMYDPNRDVNHTVEALKKQYLRSNDVQTCMNQMVERTLGYHPASEACRSCPLAGPCATKLLSFVRFDILALRDGRITSRQAQDAVERSHG